jgi:hypothetical protein
MMTRRAALFSLSGLASLASAALAAAAKEFWDEKDPSQWSKEEIEGMLNQSPWAKRASISYSTAVPGFGPGVIGRRSGVATINRSGTGATTDGGDGKLDFHAVIRWESARPIRAAEKMRLDEEPDAYVLAAIGDFPAGDIDESQGAHEQRDAMLREFTKLERHGAPTIYLERSQSITGGLRFYFSRLEPITASNKEIAFSTKMGPLEMKAKFPLKDMLYRGKLEL